MRPVLLLASLLAACASGPPPPAWQADAKSAVDRATTAYLVGETKAHDAEMDRARRALASTCSPSGVRHEPSGCAPRPGSPFAPASGASYSTVHM